MKDIYEQTQSFEIVSSAVEKLFKRVQAEVTIKDMFNEEITPYTINAALREFNQTFYFDAVGHDAGEYFLDKSQKMKHNWDEEEEFSWTTQKKASIVLLLFLLNLLSSVIEVVELNNNLRGILTITVLLGVTNLKKERQTENSIPKTNHNIVKEQFNQLIFKFAQIPLQLDHEDLDPPDVEKYRRQKQKEFDKREEDKKKELQHKKLMELNRKEINQQAAELAKKNFSYDINGNIIFVKNVHVDNLPKDTNFELKFNLKKPATNVKPSYLQSIPPPLKIGKEGSKRSKVSVNPKGAPDLLEIPGDNDKSKLMEQSSVKNGQKRNLSLDHFLQLKQGKNLKQSFAHIKPKTKEIFPMGSNFEKINPDLGIMVEEKGRQKRGNLNFSTHFGKFSLNEYQSRFSKTSLNFQSFEDNKNSTYRNNQKSQNTLGIDQYSITKVQRGGNSTNGDINNQDQNTLQLTYQTGGDSTINLNQLISPPEKVKRDQIKFKKGANHNSDILMSPNSTLQNDLYRSSSKDLLNESQKSFLPNFNREQSQSQPTLKKNNRNVLSQGNLSQVDSELPPIKNQLEEMNQRILYNGGMALMVDGRVGQKKQTKRPKNIHAINSILLTAKQSQKSFGQTMYSTMGSQSIFNRTRQRPYIEKINANNKNHLPPPPIGKTLGHGFQS